MNLPLNRKERLDKIESWGRQVDGRMRPMATHKTKKARLTNSCDWCEHPLQDEKNGAIPSVCSSCGELLELRRYQHSFLKGEKRVLTSDD